MGIDVFLPRFLEVACVQERSSSLPSMISIGTMEFWVFKYEEEDDAADDEDEDDTALNSL